MILCDKSIIKLHKTKKLFKSGFKEKLVQAASYDCTLGDSFLIPETNIQKGHIDVKDKQRYRKLVSKEMIIPPHSFLLATINEFLNLPQDVCAIVEGKSSIGRLGLFIQNAGWINPGFKGKITLELYNANCMPIKLKYNMGICQLVFQTVDAIPRKAYAGKMQNQKDVQGSKIYKEISVKTKKLMAKK